MYIYIFLRSEKRKENPFLLSEGFLRGKENIKHVIIKSIYVMMISPSSKKL